MSLKLHNDAHHSTVDPTSWSCHYFLFNSSYMEPHVLMNFLLVLKWPNVQGAIWTLGNVLAGESDGSVPEAWQSAPAWVTGEDTYCVFRCSIRLCMNFFHLLAPWAKSSPNAKVFIMAEERAAGFEVTPDVPPTAWGRLELESDRSHRPRRPTVLNDSNLLYKFGNRLTTL